MTLVPLRHAENRRLSKKRTTSAVCYNTAVLYSKGFVAFKMEIIWQEPLFSASWEHLRQVEYAFKREQTAVAV